MSRASIVGIGMTPFGNHDKPLPELFAEAVEPAFDDAGVEPTDIDSLYFGNALGGLIENDTHLAPKVATYLGLGGKPAQRFEDACATSSNALKHAIQALEAGVHDVVLVGGVERCSPTTGIETAKMTRLFGSGVHRQYEQPAGLTAPSLFGLMTQRHMHEYGTTREQLAEVAVKNHAHGSLNPRAQFGDDASIDDVMESRSIAEPFCLMDCCPFSDGASALVLTRPKDATKYKDDAVDIQGIGHGTDAVPLADKDRPYEAKAAKIAAEQAYEQAGIAPSDVDVAEVHDCFTGAEILAIEALGLFEPGEGGPATAAGQTYIDGEIPINPSGGLNAKGHPIGATGTAQVVELVEHLRNEARERQVDGVETAVTHNLGGDAATTIVTVLEGHA
jgi:acetyl-CoA C-acetyltransferase/acetyl-CoA acyltransferase